MKPDQITHISVSRRRDGNSGGVEKFAWYLERAIGAKLLIDSEYRGEYIPNTLYIVDGGHGLNIPDRSPILSVCHGTWVAVWQRWQFMPEPIDHPQLPYESSQARMWGTPGREQSPAIIGKSNVLPIACSSGAKRELVCYHAREDAPVLLHGIDHDIYVPHKTHNAKPVILHVASEWRKGSHLIPQLSERLSQFQFEFLNAKIGEEPSKFSKGDMFIHMSCSEGNSYACLESMSCNLPMVVTNVGLFEGDVKDEMVGKVIPYYSTIDQMAEAIVEVWETKERFNPREWIIQHATFQHFKERWEELIFNAEDFGLTLS
jgi:hypothetical protein